MTATIDKVWPEDCSPPSLLRATEELRQEQEEERRRFLARLLEPRPPQPPRDRKAEEKFNAEMPAYRARARELMQQRSKPEPTSRPEEVAAERNVLPRRIARARPVLNHTLEQKAELARRRVDRILARLEALGPCPDLAGLSTSFAQDSDVMVTATRYVGAWIEKRGSIEAGCWITTDEEDDAEQRAFERELEPLKLLKKDFDDAQQRVIDGIMEPYYASLQAAP
jgi:hypothetical protein